MKNGYASFYMLLLFVLGNLECYMGCWKEIYGIGWLYSRGKMKRKKKHLESNLLMVKIQND